MRANYDSAKSGAPLDFGVFTNVLLHHETAGHASYQRQPETGRRFGPYEILSRLGGGGMGIVYRAWDERLHREVALKVLHDTYQPPGVRQRFLIEARAASALNHPHICTIFDIGQQDGDPYLVMELLEGMTLKERISLGAPPVEEFVRYAIEIADALASAHAKHIIHRDIKPENIFLQRRPDGGNQVKVLDFGLAKIRDEGSGTRMARALDITGVGLTVGTLAYMSPEQARGEPLDARSDLFSLGVVMYEMATRRVPFRGQNSAVMLVELLRHEPEPMRQWNDSIPRPLEKLVMRLLAKDRASRYQSAVEVREALRKLDLKCNGGWLRRPKQTVVPLVQAPDPVARMPHLLARPRSADEDTSRRQPQPLCVSSVDPSAVSPRPADNVQSVSAPDPSHDGAPDSAIRPAKAPAVADWIPPRRDQRVQESGSRTIAVRPSGEQAARAAELSVSARHGNESNKVASEQQPKEKSEAPKVDETTKATMETAKAPDSEPGSSRSMSTTESRLPASLSPGILGNQAQVAASRRASWRAVCFASVILILASGMGFVLKRNGFHLGEVILGSNSPVLLTPVANRTGDSSLDEVATAAMELELEQSRVLRIHGLDEFFAGRERVHKEDHAPTESVTVRRVAEVLEARAYIYGELRQTSSGYLFSVQLLDTRSNDRRATAELTAKTRAEIPDTVQLAVRQLRSSMGETQQQIAETARPLSSEGTRDLRALRAFAEAHEAVFAGDMIDAQSKLERATESDPAFLRAQLELAWQYEEHGDETAAADRARVAVQNAGKAGEPLKLLAASADALFRIRDQEQAFESLRRYQELEPESTAGPVAVARLRRRQWRTTEELLAAQQAVSKDRYDSFANRELVLAYLSLDRVKSAQQAAAEARAAGLAVDPAVALLLHFMEVGGTARWLEQEGRRDQAQPEADAMRALLLDNTGQFAAGGSLWRELAAQSGDSPSRAAWLRARGALNRALAGQCGAAREFLAGDAVSGSGVDARFRAALAGALCGDTTRAVMEMNRSKAAGAKHGSETERNDAMLEAAVALAQKDGLRAETVLRLVQQRDESPIAIYLRGLALWAERRPGAAIADLETVAARRGCALLTDTDLYPVTLAKLAEMYAAQQDMAQSEAARRRLSEIGWTVAAR